LANPKILVVEGDNIILTVEKWRLSKMGFDICGSTGIGEDAVQYAEKLRPDIVLMDIALKGTMDGIEAAGLIKKNFNIPVIFISSLSDNATIVRAMEVNPDGFIKKPFNDDDLRIAIHLALKK
jgi:DNA-binding NarL/FixJ family response regulator